jgi:hypothetical protein
MIKNKLHASCSKIFLCLLLTGHLGTVAGQTLTSSEYQVKAVFLYNFTHFVDWPAGAFEHSYEPFIIGIVGKDPFGHYLQDAVAQERIGSHIIRIEHYESAADIKDCHILYVGSQDPDEIRRVLRAVSNKKILTVGDTPNFIRWGGMIRFFTENNKIRLQINNTLAKDLDLKISSKLLRVSQVI